MVEAILVEAHHRCIPFRVIVVDCKPYLEGLKVLSTLSALGVDVTYCHLEALGHMIPAATKVLLGASALFSNGALLNRAGTALVCLLAKRQAIPVIVVAQACKFSDKVGLLDSSGGHAGMYDVTPSELLTMLITEMGLLPVTSVPVVLREYNIALTNV
jgi:translation initiation factor eIF-2B subunit delta